MTLTLLRSLSTAGTLSPFAAKDKYLSNTRKIRFSDLMPKIERIFDTAPSNYGKSFNFLVLFMSSIKTFEI